MKKPKLQGSPVAYTRPEVRALIPDWQRVDDCCAGERIIKERTTVYLPMPKFENDTAKDRERYAAYIARAVFYNVTGRTLRGMSGMVFAKDANLELPTLLEMMKDDVDGGNSNLEQQARETLSYGLKYGRAGLLTDYPVKAGSPTTRKEQLEGEVKPTITLYSPYQITNWRTSFVKGKIRLLLLVLKETYAEGDDGFEVTQKTQYRVLRLEDLGGRFVTTVQLHREVDKTDDFAPVDLPSVVTDSKGQPFDEIPFAFVGSDNNLDLPNQPPLLDLANLNVAHYRNSADYEEASFMVGQPTLILAGVTEEWNKRVLQNKVQLGSRGGVPLPQGASAELLQAEANSMPFEAMTHKEKQMVAIGARLIQEGAVQRTATEASADKAAENSVLANTAANVSDAYKRCLQWAARFVGADPKQIKFELNRDFASFALAAQDILAIVQAWQAEIIAKSEARDVLRRGRVATLPDEEAADEIEAAGPTLATQQAEREQGRQDEQDELARQAAEQAAQAAKKGGAE